MMHILFLLLGFFAPSQAADPTQPHLAQAWSAYSQGDGEPGAIGQDSYIYTDDPAYKKGGVRGHWFKYDDCQKLELNQWKPKLIEKAFYFSCDSINCCYKPDTIVKKWDFHSFFANVSFAGYVNTTELHELPVVGAERWVETDKIPFGKASYEYFITRQGEDIITHRINYGGSGVNPGSILYGNFSVQHDVTEFAKTFAEPTMDCSLQCPDELVAKWESSYFSRNSRKSSFALV